MTLEQGMSGIALGAKSELTIGEVATRFDVTLRALRFYEARGLLAPRREGSRRLYDTTQIHRLKRILKGKSLGFTLGEIIDLFAQMQSEGAVSGEFDLPRTLVVSQLETLRQRRNALDAAIADLEETGRKMAEAVQDSASQRLAG